MAATTVPRRAPSRRPRARSLTPLFFLAPALVSIAVLTLLPIIYSVVVAFTNYNLYTTGGPQDSGLLGTAHFVGLQNFADLLAPGGPYTQVFVPVFAWTVTFAVITSILNYGAGFLLAVLVNNPRLPERGIYRTVLIIPWALPGAITILVWQGLLNQSFGAVDALLTSVGLPSVPWLIDPTGTRAAIFLVNLWLSFPFYMIVCTGGLQSIPGDIYEAANIDGASAAQRLRLITLPLVFQVTRPMLVASFSFEMMNFGIVYLLNGGNPPRSDTSFAGSTDVLASFIYKLTLTFNRYDKAAALGLIIFAITAALSLIGFRVSGVFKEVQA